MNQNTGYYSGQSLKDALQLYAITDRHWLKEGETLQGAVEQALLGGATMLQLREKHMDSADMEAEAKIIMSLCREHHVPFIINDDVDMACRLGADGVHVGQSDMEAGEVRQLIGPDRIIGVSAQTVDEAVLAESHGADYLGVGAVFPTGSKDDAIEVDHETVRKICQAVSIPVIAIGGITRDNITELNGLGLAGISVISAIFGQPDIRGAAEDLKRRTGEMLREHREQ